MYNNKVKTLDLKNFQIYFKNFSWLKKITSLKLDELKYIEFNSNKVCKINNNYRKY